MKRKKGLNMKIIIPNIRKDERQNFKKRMQLLSRDINVTFEKENATVSIIEPYIIIEESILEKSRIKKAIDQAVKDFRLYQFHYCD